MSLVEMAMKTKVSYIQEAIGPMETDFAMETLEHSSWTYPPSSDIEQVLERYDVLLACNVLGLGNTYPSKGTWQHVHLWTDVDLRLT